MSPSPHRADTYFSFNLFPARRPRAAPPSSSSFIFIFMDVVRWILLAGSECSALIAEQCEQHNETDVDEKTANEKIANQIYDL